MTGGGRGNDPCRYMGGGGDTVLDRRDSKFLSKCQGREVGRVSGVWLEQPPGGGESGLGRIWRLLRGTREAVC